MCRAEFRGKRRFWVKRFRGKRIFCVKKFWGNDFFYVPLQQILLMLLL